MRTDVSKYHVPQPMRVLSLQAQTPNVIDMENTLFITDALPGLKSFPAWLAITYGGVVVAMAVDFATGVRKALKAGIATQSRGYKRTCDKAVKYFLPMLCLTCIDLISSVFFTAPFLTMAMGTFNIFCEWKSVMESTHEKKQIHDAADTIRTVIENRDDIAGAISEVIEKYIKNKSDEKD